MNADEFIRSCDSWEEFWTKGTLLQLKDDKKVIFERLTQAYLQSSSEYCTILKNVWLLNEVPIEVCKRINLPSQDEGIDIIAETKQGKYWAIQSKFRSNIDKALTRTDLGTFTSLAFNTCKNISLAIVAHTSTKSVAKAELLRSTVEIGFERWQQLDDEISKGITGWSILKNQISNKIINIEPRVPREHQQEAILRAKKHFVVENNCRGRIIMPCGTGKSLTAFWIAEDLSAKTILIAVPSLNLIKQSLSDWTREYLSKGKKPDWLCVCSDDTVGALEKDEFVGDIYSTGLPTCTNKEEIIEFLKNKSEDPKIVFTTYQSSKNLANAAKSIGFEFDLAILDEAHKTVGHIDRTFATLLYDKKITIKHRIFMTATERVLRGENKNVVSMDENEDIYGQRFYQLSFKDAIQQKIISDCRIIAPIVTDLDIKELIKKNLILDFNISGLSKIDAQSIAAGIALKKTFQKYNAHHAISFHRSIKLAERFRKQLEDLNSIKYLGPSTSNFHISGKSKAGERTKIIKQYAKEKKAIITNARCLTEGVDIPAVDTVIFADPKQSVIDIVQASGRALRKFDGKEYGYIVVPIIVPEDMNFEEFAETTAFKQVAKTITALSTQDERIAEEFRLIQAGNTSKGKIINIETNLKIGLKLDLEDFVSKISLKIWENVGPANWRPFEESRLFARSLNCNSIKDWLSFCKTEKKPKDIPTTPNSVYQNQGWIGWDDWLATSNQRPNFRTYCDAEIFACSLGLKSATEWHRYAKSEIRPADIPAKPQQVYAGNGWVSFGKWLGTGRQAYKNINRWPFEKAKTFARLLNLKSRKEWDDYCKTGQRPQELPASPNYAYRESGWLNWGDWLGTGRVADQLRTYWDFEKSRSFARNLHLKGIKDWHEFCRSGQKPAEIPAKPWETYKMSGWVSIGDWLGTGSVANNKREYLEFIDARSFVHQLKLKTVADWHQFVASGNKPLNIPSHPHKIYKNFGWIDYSDWLGSGRVASKNRDYWTHEIARRFVHGLELKNVRQWEHYIKSGEKPAEIPSSPQLIYLEKGWVNWGDWLGTGNIGSRSKKI